MELSKDDRMEGLAMEVWLATLLMRFYMHTKTKSVGRGKGRGGEREGKKKKERGGGRRNG